MTLAELLIELEIERMQPTRPALTNQTMRKARRMLAIRERARFDAQQRQYRDKQLLPAKKPCVSADSLMRQVEKIEQLKAKLRRIA